MARATNEKPAEVLKVAAGLFQTRGYQGTSMDDVAAGVSLNKGTIYHYFPSKAAILYEIYAQTQRAVIASIEDIDPEASPIDALDQLIRAQLHLLVEFPAETVVYFQEMRWITEWFDAEQVKEIRKRERVFTQFVTDLVQRGIDEGDFAPTDAKIAAFGLIGMSAWSYQWFRPGGRRSVDDIADVFRGLMLGGLRGARAPARSR